MPIWIVKKIFSYLDKKSLTKAKKVNAYWAWVIKDFNKDLKIERLLEKNIIKMQVNTFKGRDIVYVYLELCRLHSHFQNI